MATPGASSDLTNPKVPGSPLWWMSRLAQRLMDRQWLYELRADYAEGRHPLPNGDRRYVKALKDLQDKAKTNYIELVQLSVIEKMHRKGFRFGESAEADKDAERIWQYNDMDLQGNQLLWDAAKYGFCFALVLPPDEPGGEPVIVRREPKFCEVEYDSQRPTKVAAGLEFWEDEPSNSVLAILYLPEATYYFQATKDDIRGFVGQLSRTGVASSINEFKIVAAERNANGVVPLVRGDWEPAYGDVGRAEGEAVWSIQNRINKTVLDRLVISKSQAYRQRWVSGAPSRGKATVRTGGTPNKKAEVAIPPWDAGADMIWASTDPNTTFGDFQEADIKQILEAVRDDAGDIAAITQTPATYLTNRLVNVSGDTILQANAGHNAKIRLRQQTMGFFYERLIKLGFRYNGDSEKATDVTAETIWEPPEVHSLAEVSDAFGKLTAAGVPLQLAMEKSGLFTTEEIAWAVQEAERMKQEQMMQEEQAFQREVQMKQMEMDNARMMKQTKSNSPGEK